MPPGPCVELPLWIFGGAVKNNCVTTGDAPAQLQHVVKPHADGAHPLFAHQLMMQGTPALVLALPEPII